MSNSTASVKQTQTADPQTLKSLFSSGTSRREVNGDKPTKPNFKWREGRKFHDVESVEYPFPIDLEETDRLHIQHYLLRFVHEGKDFHAPVTTWLEKGAKVLDVGCGSGVWTLEMATTYTGSEFYGVDLADNFPKTIKPPNCHFEKLNIFEGLPFPDETFDYVYQRAMTLAYTMDQWALVLQEIKRVLKKGGYAELCDVDMMGYDYGPVTNMLNHRLVDGLQTRNVDVTYASRMDQTLVECGLECTHKLYVSVPMGERHGIIGRYWQQDTILAIQSAKGTMCSILGITPETYSELTTIAIKEFDQYDTYVNWHTAVGKKNL